MNKIPFASAGKGNMYWMILYIGAIIIFPKLFGSISGIIAAIVLIFGIYKITHKADLSKGKKITYSLLTAIGSVALAIILSLVLVTVFEKVTDTKIDNSNVSPSIETSQNTSVQSGFSTYKFKNAGLTTSYPSGWTVTESEDGYAVSFTSPDQKADIGMSLNVLENGQSMTLEQFKSGVIEQSKNNTDGTLDQSSVVIKKVNGKDWLFLNSTIKENGQVYYVRSAVFVTGNYNNSQYIQVSLNSYKDNFSTSAALFDKVVESIKF
jgi:hypothetical protein